MGLDAALIKRGADESAGAAPRDPTGSNHLRHPLLSALISFGGMSYNLWV